LTDKHSKKVANEQTRLRIKLNARVVSLFTFLSRILGAVRDLVMLHVFGAGAIYDAFIIALTIPNVLRRLTAEGSLSMVFVPLYTDIREKRGIDDARRFAQKVASLIIIFCTLLTALGIAYSETIVQIFASGFDTESEKFLITVSLTKIMFPYLVFISLVALAMGILNSERHFAAPAAAPILLNLSIISCTLFLTEHFYYPIEAAAWGVFLAGIAQLVLQIPFLLKVKQPLLPQAFWADEDIKQLLRLMGPTLFGVAVYQINIIVLRNIASGLPDGHVSYYNIASRLQELIIGVFAFAYATASLPEFSKHSSEEDWESAFQTLKSTISSTMFLVLPASAGFTAFALPVVSILFLHGEFNWQDAQVSAGALQLIAFGIPALALIRILVAIFFAMKDTKSPVLASCISLLVTGFSGYFFAQQYQVSGLTLALSIGAWAQAGVLLFILRLKHKEALHCLPLLDLAKYLGASLIIAIGVNYATTLSSWEGGPGDMQNWFVFVMVVTGSVALYILALWLIKDQNARELARTLSGKLSS
jgi:putative peptidoglycan lipid II flippase